MKVIKTESLDTSMERVRKWCAEIVCHLTGLRAQRCKMSLHDILVKCNFLRAFETAMSVFCFFSALSSINN